MCQTCSKLLDSISRASAAGNQHKAAVMASLLHSHQRECKEYQKHQLQRPALITDQVVFWPNGSIWEVRG